MKLIPLTQGYFAQVDDADFEWLNQWNWQARVCKHTVYATMNARKNGKRTTVQMHRVILGVTDPKIFVDHEDLCGLNNQRENIRLCTNAQNIMNIISRSNSSSRFKGVFRNTILKKWLASIKIDGKSKHIGLYDSEEDAARNYNLFAKEHHKEFARLNQVEPMFPPEEAARAYDAKLPTNATHVMIFYLIYIMLLGIFVVCCIVIERLNRIIELLKNPPTP